MDLTVGHQLDIETTLNIGVEGGVAGLEVLASKGPGSGVRISFDGTGVVVGEGYRDVIALSQDFQPQVDLRIVVDRKIVEVYADGKALTQIVNQSPQEMCTEQRMFLFSETGSARFGNLAVFSLRSAYR